MNWLSELLSNRKHNRKLRREGLENPNVKVETVIGWEPDPIEHTGGWTRHEASDTASHEVEYSRPMQPKRRS